MYISRITGECVDTLLDVIKTIAFDFKTYGICNLSWYKYN